MSKSSKDNFNQHLKGAKKILVGSKEAQPWKVTLFVRPSLLATDLEPVVYFVRGINTEVGNIAYLMWKRWEKDDVGLGEQQYPDVEEAGQIECIDEQDFMCAYRDILKYKLPHAVAGNPIKPTVFTCFKRTNLL